MATPTEVDRCHRLERQDASLTSLKLGISSYSNAQPTLLALRNSTHLKELYIRSATNDHYVGRLCREVLLQNSSVEQLTLDLRECSDDGAQYLAELIQRSTSLKWLSLVLNNMTEKGALRLANALPSSSLLGFAIYATQLDLHDCCIGDKGAIHFADALKACRTLTSICIAQNAVTNAGLESLLDAVSSNEMVATLDLHSNQIDKTGTVIVAQFLSLNTTLKQLILDENHDIGSEGAKEIALALCQNSSLETLSLRSCSIGRKGAERFATTLSENKVLKELNLCGNVDIGDDAVELISRGLKQNSTLQKLNLSSCSIGDEGCAYLADALVENATLTHLTLHKNEVGDGGVLALSGTLTRNQTLSSLVLTENRFGEKGALALVQSLQHNSSLTTLVLEASGREKGDCCEGLTSSTVGILLAKNRQLAHCKRMIRELQQKNQALVQERDALKADLYTRKSKTQ